MSIKNVDPKKNPFYSYSRKAKSQMKDSLSILMIYSLQEKLLNSITWMKKKLSSIQFEEKSKEKENQIPEITAGIGLLMLSKKIYT